MFLCRSRHRWVGLSGNKLLLWGVAVEIALILLIGYTPWSNAIFGTLPIGADAWAVISFTMAMLVLEQGRKRLARKN